MCYHFVKKLYDLLKPIYLKFYSTKNIKENGKIYAGIYFMLILTLIALMLLQVLFLYLPTLKPFLGVQTYNLYTIIISIIILFLLVAFQTWSGDEKNKWIHPYMFNIVIGIVVMKMTLPWNLIWFCVLCAILSPHIYNSWNKPRWDLIWTVVSCLFILGIGIALINSIFGFRTPDEFVLNSKNASPPNLNISCLSPGQSYAFSERYVYCGYSQTLQNQTVELEILFRNSSRQVINSFQNSFYASSDIESLYFKVRGHTNQNVYSEYTGIISPHYISEEKYQENREKSLTYFLGLLFLTFITIPKLIQEVISTKKKK